MIELLFQTIAVLAYLCCGFLIAGFSHGGFYHRGYSFLATVLIASFMGQTIHILFFKDPVTLWDAFFSVVLAVIIYKRKGNVARLFRSAS